MATEPSAGALWRSRAGELHLGAEVALMRSTPLVALRAGVWLDPDHRLRATDDADLDSRALRPAGDAFERLKLDLAVDVSDLVDTVSLSAIYSF